LFSLLYFCDLLHLSGVFAIRLFPGRDFPHSRPESRLSLWACGALTLGKGSSVDAKLI